MNEPTTVVVTVPDIACIRTDFKLGPKSRTLVLGAWTRQSDCNSLVQTAKTDAERKGEQKQGNEKSKLSSNRPPPLQLSTTSYLAIGETYSAVPAQ